MKHRSALRVLLLFIGIVFAAFSLGQVGTILNGPAPKQIYVKTKSEAAIRSAITRAKATPGPDIIYLPDGGTTGIVISAPLPAIAASDHISFRGIRPVLTHSGNVPDNDFTFVGGTWFKPTPGQEGVFDCFQQQSTAGTDLTQDLGSPGINFTTNAVRGMEISDIGIQGFRNGISMGAQNQCGLLWGSIHDIWIRDCTGWGLKLANWQHIELYRVWSYANVTGAGRLYADVATGTLAPGNSRKMSDLFDNPGFGMTQAQYLKHRGWVFEATAGSNLNEVYAVGVQANWFAKSAGAGYPKTFTASSTSTNTATFSGSGSNFQVGQSVKFTNAGGNSGITTGQTLFIKSVSTDTLTFSDTRNGSAIATTFSSNPTFTTFGYSNVEVIGGASNGKVTNSCFIGLDLEGQAQGSFSAENMTGCFVLIVELFANPSNQQHIVLRTSQANNFIVTNDYTTDIDGASVTSIFNGARHISNSVQQYPLGIQKDAETSDVVLSLSQYSGGLRWKANSGGGFLKPSIPIGNNYTPWPYANATMNTSNGGTLVAYGNAATAITLPSVDTSSGSSGSANTTGWRCRIYNYNTGILSVTAPSNTFDGLTGKTVAALPAKTATSVCYVDVEIQVVNGTSVYLSSGVGTVDWTGGTVSQAINKSAAVTLNALSGAITMVNSSLTNGTAVTFTLNDNQIQAGDVVVVNHKSGGTSGAYLVSVSAVAAGSCGITLYNCSAGALGEAVVLQFKVVKVTQ